MLDVKRAPKSNNMLTRILKETEQSFANTSLSNRNFTEILKYAKVISVYIDIKT